MYQQRREAVGKRQALPSIVPGAVVSPAAAKAQQDTNATKDRIGEHASA
jgi:hypothetical protein